MKKYGLWFILFYPLFTNAQNYDVKTWSGSACDPYYGHQANMLNKTLSGIKNISGSPTWVICTPTREYEYSNINVRLSVRINQDYPGYTTCLFTTRNLEGGIYTSGYGNTRLGSGNIEFDITAGDAVAPRVLACKLSSGTTLSNFIIYEADN